LVGERASHGKPGRAQITKVIDLALKMKKDPHAYTGEQMRAVRARRAP
jgi:hypothetical protein